MLTDGWLLGLLVLGPLLVAGFTYVCPRAAQTGGTLAALALVGLTTLVVLRVDLQGMIEHRIGAWGAPLGINLYVDGLSATMLAMTATIGLLISLYAGAYLRHESERAQHFFWPLWLFMWSSLNALFVSGDIFNLYVTLELLGLSAVALAALNGSREALVAAIRYLLIALAASLLYLLGVALIYALYGVVDWRLLSHTIDAAPVARVALALMVIGLLVKSAICPLHIWLPPAHANAPAPVSAALSALVVKGGIYILLRLWFWAYGNVTHQQLGTVLACLGALAIVWGSLMALRQRRLKLLVAYSTVAQLGYLMLVFALSSGPEASRLAWQGTVYFVLAHAFAKAAMFLAAGTIMQAAGHDRIDGLTGIAQRLPMACFAFGLAGVSLMGLPPSGGFVAKWLLLNAAVTSQRWWWVLVLILGGLLAAAYVFRFVNRAILSPTEELQVHRVPRRLQVLPLVLAGLAILLGVFADETLAIIDRALPPAIVAEENQP